MSSSAPKSQADRILAHLRSGRGITPIGALELFGCFRLAARIRELRDAGYEIFTGGYRTRNGKRVASYRMPKEE